MPGGPEVRTSGDPHVSPLAWLVPNTSDREQFQLLETPTVRYFGTPPLENSAVPMSDTPGRSNPRLSKGEHP
jgi:hypothetical protein